MYLRFGKREWNFLLKMGIILLSIILTMVIPVGILFYAVKFSIDSDRFLKYLTLFYLLFLYVAIPRFSLVFPDVAIDQHALSFRHSWSITKNNTIRLSLGMFIITFPSYFVTKKYDINNYWPPNSMQEFFITALADVVILIFCFAEIALCAIYLSLVYKFAFEHFGQSQKSKP